MKKIKLFCILLLSIFIFNVNVFAASGDLKVSSSSVTVKNKFTVTVNVSGAAAWNIHVTSTGPVSGCTINEADVTSDAKDTNKTFTANCTATKEGTITISLTGDITSSKDGKAVILSEKKTVKVTKATTTSKKTTTKSSNNTTTTKVTTTSKIKSDNNKIKEINVEGYVLKKINDNNYTLSVSRKVTNVNVTAEPEDLTAKINNTGNHNLNIGENNIEIIVSSESGLKNTINIKITRKNEYYIDDLDEVLKDDNISDITIDKDTIIKKEDLDKIKESNKKINFNYYGEDEEPEYTWVIDGSKLDETNDFLSTVIIESKNKDEMMKKSNSPDGLYVGLEEKNNIPSNIKLKINTRNKFDNNTSVRNYGYDNNFTLVEENLNPNDNYLEFSITTAKDYLLTLIDITKVSNTNISDTQKNVTPLLILFGIIIILVIYIIFSKKKEKEAPTKNKNNQI